MRITKPRVKARSKTLAFLYRRNFMEAVIKELQSDVKKAVSTAYEAKEEALKNKQEVELIKAKVDDSREDIKEIKSFQNKLMFAILSTMATGILTLVTLIINLLSKR